MSTIVLETRDLSKRYGDHIVVDSVNIAAHEGEVTYESLCAECYLRESDGVLAAAPAKG